MKVLIQNEHDFRTFDFDTEVKAQNFIKNAQTVFPNAICAMEE